MTDKLLLQALVTPEHQQLYMTSASFHSKINLLAQLIPEWIAGMAATAVEQDEQQRRAVDMMATGGVLSAHFCEQLGESNVQRVLREAGE